MKRVKLAFDASQSATAISTLCILLFLATFIDWPATGPSSPPDAVCSCQ
jgi:hypothetical protein